MDKLKIRAYNIRFGDAYLISVPDKGSNNQVKTRYILVDVGNSLSRAGGIDDVFEPVVKDILAVLGGNPLDLYIMTHEHMDHIQGLPYAQAYHFQNENLKDKLKVQYAWFTASSETNYYSSHPEAKEKKLMMEEAYFEIQSYFNFLKASGEYVPSSLENLLLVNNPRRTKDNVKYLQDLALHNYYVHRESDLQGTHPFNEAQFEIWAPEEDTSIYYGRFRPMALGLISTGRSKRKSIIPELIPPPGVDADDFYNLVKKRRGYLENLLAIDKAANNTSLVFCLKWRGWRLLFTGDAEVRSWKTMNKYNQLKPVHFIKISHHGSHTGTPDDDLLGKVLPEGQHDDRTRKAVVSTWKDTYNNVPDQATVDQYDPNLPEERRRCDELHVLDHNKTPGSFEDIEFEDLG